MDIRQMRYFLEICKKGSISQAAGSLFISPQGLSCAIRRLEQELGCDLFYRKSNTLVLTEQGQYFLENASDIVDKCDALQNHYRYLGHDTENRLSVICVYSVLAKCPLPLQALFMKDDPHFNLSVGECYSNECAQYLDGDNCSFALCYQMDWCRSYACYPLFSVEHCFVVHRDHPLAGTESISIEQLQGARIIIPDARLAIRSKLDKLFQMHNVTPTVVFESSQVLQIYKLISRDHSLVARVTLGDALAMHNPDFHILRMNNADLSTQVLLAHRRDKQLSVVERLFLQSVLAASRAADPIP